MLYCFRAETRCRHYMVDPTPSNKYVVVGEPKVHKTLEDLVKYHQKVSFSSFLSEHCCHHHMTGVYIVLSVLILLANKHYI